MQKIVNELINSSIRRVDVYRWKDATWLIFTDETRWVVELTDEGTLWYNYKFFKDVFKYVSINVGTEMDGYIIQWANDFFYKDCAHRSAAYPRDKDRTKTSKVLENGIKNLSGTRTLGEHYIDMVVTSGIKDTQGLGKNHGDEFEWHTRAVIDNGVKEILQSSRVESNSGVIEEVIEKGIKEVNKSDSIHRQMRAENLVPRIIKDVKPNRVTLHNEKMDRFYYDPYCRANKTEIWRIVEEGVKNIYPDMDPDVYDWSDEFKADIVIQGGMKVVPLPTKEGINGYSAYFDSKGWEGKSHTEYVKDAIEGGIKVIPLPDPSGELRGYSDYYNTKEDRTKPHTEYVKDAIDGGTKL
jgi:hypothetical protein